MKTLTRVSLALLTFALLALPALADRTTSGTVLAADDQRVVLASPEGVHLYEVPADIERPDDLAMNQVVVIEYRDAEQRTASRIMPVGERIEVVGTEEGETLALLGEVKRSSTDRFILQTTEGDKAFVVRPDRLLDHPVAPGETVAVIYHVEDGAGALEEYVASDIRRIEGLPPSLETVKVRYARVGDVKTDRSETAVAKAGTGDAARESAKRESKVGEDDRMASTDDARKASLDQRETSSADSDRSSDAAETLPRTSGYWVAILLVGLGALGTAVLLGRRY